MLLGNQKSSLVRLFYLKLFCDHSMPKDDANKINYSYTLLVKIRNYLLSSSVKVTNVLSSFHIIALLIMPIYFNIWLIEKSISSKNLLLWFSCICHLSIVMFSWTQLSSDYLFVSTRLWDVCWRYIPKFLQNSLIQ